MKTNLNHLILDESFPCIYKSTRLYLNMGQNLSQSLKSEVLQIRNINSISFLKAVKKSMVSPVLSSLKENRFPLFTHRLYYILHYWIPTLLNTGRQSVSAFWNFIITEDLDCCINSIEWQSASMHSHYLYWRPATKAFKKFALLVNKVSA